MTGAAITLAGAVITIVFNVILIPRLHYLGAAIATFSCYLVMMIISYYLGQKHYPVPYPKKKLIAYLVLTVLIYGLHRGLTYIWENRWFNMASASILFLLFALFVIRIERKELQRMPILGKWLKPKFTPGNPA